MPGRVMRRRGSDAGVTALMTAMLMPAVIFLMMLVVQAGLYYHARQRATAAADRAVAAARTPSGTESSGRDAAQLFLDGAPLDEASVQVDRGVDQVEATVSGYAPELLPGLRWRVEVNAAAPAERFIPENERR
jgi:Flp pilus assembly protein TadG